MLQWIGILGALAGVLLGGVLAMWQERRRWTREDSIKWQM
jgi:ABC-type lipoprotein release transport system permease subunit